MNLKPTALGLFLCALAGSVQAAQVTVDPNDSAMVRAQANLENVEKLVISGVLPRLRLDQAKENVEDARDVAVLHQTLYGKELTIDQADEMIAAAQRRVDRKQHAQVEMQKLLTQGIISKSEMSTYSEEADRAIHELDWAKSRARLIIELNAMVQARTGCGEVGGAGGVGQDGWPGGAASAGRAVRRQRPIWSGGAGQSSDGLPEKVRDRLCRSAPTARPLSTGPWASTIAAGWMSGSARTSRKASGCGAS